eukprot:1144388-Pelagomonas_calceolata.AAC.9
MLPTSLDAQCAPCFMRACVYVCVRVTATHVRVFPQGLDCVGATMVMEAMPASCDNPLAANLSHS